jgi:acyl-CoA synthetase (NDP forming)/RimJ/RimL family protein N-acetyltransferase
MNPTIALTTDPAFDILRSEHQPLGSLFAPKTVAVIGASDKLGSVGRTLLWNLVSNSFGGTVFPVNPKHHSIMGIKAYPNLEAIPEPVDLAVIATPAPTVPTLVRECAAIGVKSAIIVSAGFKEIGAKGIELEQQILREARRGRLRIIGPNCLGVMNPHTGLNATFAGAMARPGNVGFISQSGALCTSILDWSFRENVGFSAFISIGSMLDIDWGDLIYYLGDDPHTQSIVIYMESIGDARSFLSAAREVALTKPIIIIKAGKTDAGAKASTSHTGALTGSDEVLDAAFRRCGVLRVTSISELFDMAEVLAKQPRPKGPRLTAITNAGGPGVLAIDMLTATNGELAEILAGEEILNSASIPTYPYPDAAARVFNYMWQYSYNLRGIYETPALPEETDGLPDRNLAKDLIAKVHQTGRTLLTENESKQILTAYGIPTVETYLATSEEEAIEFADRIGYPVVLKLHSETITHKTDVGGVQLNLSNADAVRGAYRAIKESVEKISSASQPLSLSAFQGVTVQPMIQRDGGYELILGSSVDPQFGSVLLFGVGGQLVEVFKDRAIALPPLNTTLARRMMEQTKIYKALQGVRGRQPVDLTALEELLVRFSQLVVEQRWIKEIDINPLLALPLGESDRQPLLALDARIVLHESTITQEQLPKLAIRPYPTQYVTPWTLKDGTAITIRPIRPEDEPLAVRFHKTLSEQSVYFRYFHLMKLTQRIAHDRLMRLCFIDYDREMALVADYKNPETGMHEILAVGRLSKLHGVSEAEFSMMVSDPFQCRGLGTEMLRRLIQIGRNEQIKRITADILPDNLAMQRVCEKVGFRLDRRSELGVVGAEIELND